jgi:bifunctional non-homologous end joining protein LigD
MEGIVAKDASGSYQEGTRSTSWLKVKNVESQEAIIIGYTAPRASRKHLGALVLGAYEGSRLRYIGHSGGGFTDKELGEMFDRLSKIKLKSSPVDEKVPMNSPITWVKPKYVCEVSFSEWTPDGRMRHPVYLGLRNDKKPLEVIREEVLDVKQTKKNKNTPLSEDVKISHPDKVYWPKEGYTKKDLVDYYSQIADTILPYLIDRPENLFPDNCRSSHSQWPGMKNKDLIVFSADKKKNNGAD